MRIAMAWMITGLVLWGAGCDPSASNAGGTIGPGGDDGENAGQGASGNPGGGSSAPPPLEGACAMDRLTQPCKCPDGKSGRQKCSITTGWGPCECEDLQSAPAGDGTDGGVMVLPAEGKEIIKGPARFAWQQTLPVGGKCLAGYHEGSFDGNYNPEAMILLTLGFWATIPVFGDVSFTINEKPGSNGETFEISDGLFSGSALMAFPFEGEFYGTLDCPTRTFEGVLKRCFYIVGMDKYAFDGFARSRYDPFTNTFIDGVWSVTEPEAALIESPMWDPADLPKVEDLVFPEPMAVEPGTPIDVFPAGYKGGAGTWWGAFVSP